MASPEESCDAEKVTCASSCKILLFLISNVSFSFLISDSFCTMVPRQESRAVWRNSLSASLILILEPLCLVDIVGNKPVVLDVLLGTEIFGTHGGSTNLC